jgi:ribosome-binding factor A
MRSAGRDYHKQAQLCAEVEQIAVLALGSSRDSRLNQLMVHSVEASADGAKLTVNVIPGEAENFESLESLTEVLNAARPWLRRQIAEEIVRKRTPEIRFVIVLGLEDDSV